MSETDIIYTSNYILSFFFLFLFLKLYCYALLCVGVSHKILRWNLILKFMLWKSRQKKRVWILLQGNISNQERKCWDIKTWNTLRLNLPWPAWILSLHRCWKRVYHCSVKEKPLIQSSKATWKWNGYILPLQLANWKGHPFICLSIYEGILLWQKMGKIHRESPPFSQLQ